jgi:pyridoxine 5-phosphate synthase
MTDEDVARLSAGIDLPLNLEMAATDEMLAIALRHAPHAACIVPEKRQERTTEGGLDAVGGHNHLAPFVRQLTAANIRVSLFIEPDMAQLDAAKSLGAPVVELHTGAFCEAEGAEQDRQFGRIVQAAEYAESLGIECHAGHGFTFDTVAPVAAIPTLVELNIGHFLIGEAIFGGLESSIKRMRSLMDKARSEAHGERSA